ncbi:hypothetical protein LZ30DRAFT_822001 [Colletotrichum cereale]|nr:hypothetical protein LZ30DRAFT_822001 [Colletotrichum cereale]
MPEVSTLAGLASSPQSDSMIHGQRTQPRVNPPASITPDENRSASPDYLDDQYDEEMMELVVSTPEDAEDASKRGESKDAFNKMMTERGKVNHKPSGVLEQADDGTALKTPRRRGRPPKSQAPASSQAMPVNDRSILTPESSQVGHIQDGTHGTVATRPVGDLATVSNAHIWQKKRANNKKAWRQRSS